MDALEAYRQGVERLRDAYTRDLYAIEQQTAATINERINKMGPLVSTMPAFRDLIERWTELDPSTRLGAAHMEKVSVLYDTFVASCRALRKELGL